MDLKISVEAQVSPVPPELEDGDPPFERWIRLADALLGKPVPPLPAAAIPRDLRVRPLKH
jgi:hypothetical protein